MKQELHYADERNPALFRVDSSNLSDVIKKFELIEDLEGLKSYFRKVNFELGEKTGKKTTKDWLVAFKINQYEKQESTLRTLYKNIGLPNYIPSATLIWRELYYAEDMHKKLDERFSELKLPFDEHPNFDEHRNKGTSEGIINNYYVNITSRWDQKWLEAKLIPTMKIGVEEKKIPLNNIPKNAILKDPGIYQSEFNELIKGLYVSELVFGNFERELSGFQQAWSGDKSK